MSSRGASRDRALFLLPLQNVRSPNPERTPPWALAWAGIPETEPPMSAPEHPLLRLEQGICSMNTESCLTAAD